MKKLYLSYLILFLFLFSAPAEGQVMQVTTIAGIGVSGFSGDGGPATAARLNAPYAFAFDKTGNLYFTDNINNRVRKIDTSGIISTVAGNGGIYSTGDGGSATAAQIGNPTGICIDRYDNIYIADIGRIRKIATNGIITSIAGTGGIGYSGDGGLASAAVIDYVNGLCIDTVGNIYLAELGERVRKIATTGIITTVAGNGVAGYTGDGGPATNATLKLPNHLSADRAGNIYLSEFKNSCVRLINAAGIISTVAGLGSAGYSGDGGPAKSALLRGPAELDADYFGNILICDVENNRVRIISKSGIINTIAGTGVAGYTGDGGPSDMAKFYRPHGIIHDAKGNIYVADIGNHCIRKIKYYNTPPVFANGKKQSISVCIGSIRNSINSQLAVMDSNKSQNEIWSLIVSPLHGSVAARDTELSTGGVVTPAGLYYSPLAGYSGKDSFQVRVTDEYASDTVMIYVDVNVAPPFSITGVPHVCVGASESLSHATAGGKWVSQNSGIAIIDSVSGIYKGMLSGVTTISYTLANACSIIYPVTVDPLPINILGSKLVCPGFTTNLTNASGGSWVSSNTAIAVVGIATGVVSGISDGTVIITYTSARGCSVTTNVTVNPLPSVITGIASVCIGATTAMTNATAGGLWTSSNAGIAKVSVTGSISGISAGTAIISYKIATTGCTAFATITVNPLPAPISGGSLVCEGATLTLSNPATGGEWSSGNTSIAIVGSSSGIVSGISGGVGTITYKNGNGCRISQPVTVYSTSNISGPSVVCLGQNITLSNALTGTWSSSVTSTATITPRTGIISSISRGSATITYVLFSGCVLTKVLTVDVAPPAITGAVMTCPGQSTVLTNAATGGAWSSANTLIASVGSGTGIVAGNLKGTVTITYSLGAGCLSTTVVTVHPAPPNIIGKNRICPGAATLLSDAMPGGKWSSSPTTVASIDSITGLLSGVAAGTAEITYTSGIGCMATRTITVNVLPGAITGNMNLCPGSTTTLSNATRGGAWSSSAIGIATISVSAGIVMGRLPGTTTITYTLGTGCDITATATIDSPPPAIAGAAVVCESGTATLSNAVTGGVWSCGNTAVATVDAVSGSVTAQARGTMNITYTLPTGCFATKVMSISVVPAIMGMTTVCGGGTLKLSNTVSGGTWSSDNTTIATIGTGSGIISALSKGTSTITFTTPLGCTTTETVTVNPGPSAGTIVGLNNVCVGSLITLSNALIGGTWESTDPNVSVAMFSGSVSGVLAGTARITYTLSNSCGSAKATFVVTVKPLPVVAAIAGPSSVCMGNVVTLRDAVPGGVWSSVATVVAVGSASGIVTGVSAGTGNITYTISNSCGNISTAYMMTILPLPVAVSITGASEVCEGESILLSESVPGGVWTCSNTNAVVISGTVTGAHAGVDTIVYAVTNSCGGNSATHSVTISPLPMAGTITGVNIVCVAAVITMSNAIAGGAWSSANTNIGVDAVSGGVTGLTAGTATISYEVANSCGVAIAEFDVFVHPLPDAGIITGASNLCAGVSVTLTNAMNGGAWSSSNTDADVTDGVVTGSKAGRSTIMYTVTNMCGTDVALHRITIDPQPMAGSITGDSVVCIGTEVLLAADIAAGDWSDNGSYAHILPTGMVKGDSAGVTVITYKVINSCGIAIAQKTVSVVSLPMAGEIQGDVSLCIGAAISLTDHVAGGVWSSKSDVVSIIDGIVTAIHPGTDTVIYAVTNTCGTTATYKEINVLPLPDAGGIVIKDSACTGDTVYVKTTAHSGVWSNNNIGVTRLMETGDSIVGVIGIAAGEDDIIYSVTNSCGTASATAPFIVRADGECTQKDIYHYPFDCSGHGELMVSPNPNAGIFTINVVSDIQESVEITLINSVGQRIKAMTMVTNDPLDIDMMASPGMYILSVVAEHGQCSKKIVVTN